MRLKKIIAVFLGFLFLFLIVFGLYKTVIFLFDKLNSLKPEVSVAIVAGCSTIFISVISVIISKNYERKQQIRQDQHAKKVVIYEEFIKLWFDVLFAEKAGLENPVKNESLFIKKFLPIVTQMIPWANDDVIKSFVEFRDYATKNSENTQSKQDTISSIELMHKFESLLVNIRKDLGHSCKKIKTGDLTKVFITDYDEFSRRNSK
jgi:hypothetical protein